MTAVLVLTSMMAVMMAWFMTALFMMALFLMVSMTSIMAATLMIIPVTGHSKSQSGEQHEDCNLEEYPKVYR